MNSQKNPQNYSEIDLSKLIIGIWENKFKIFLVAALTIGITYIFELNKKPIKLVYNAKTEIRPITTYDETKYAFYNSFLKKLNQDGFFKNIEILGNFENNNYESDFKNLFIINKQILMKLFVDILNQNSTYFNAIKKFNLIEKENYSDNSKYEAAVVKLASSIRLIPPSEKFNPIYWSIELQIYDLENLKNFFIFVEKEANQKVQFYLENTIKNQIISEKKLIKFELEDIDLQISGNLENYEKLIELTKDPIKKNTLLYELNILKIRRNFLIASKDVERIESILVQTPIINSEQFYAAKLMVNSIKIKKLVKEEFSLSKKLFLASILGLILGLIFVFLSHVINTNKR